MMTATILLVRHAAHDDLGTRLSGRLPDLSLSPTGRRQAAALGAMLSIRRLAAIHTSPVTRARQTALAIAGARPVEVAPGLDEIDFGKWAGSTFAELAGDPEWQAWNKHRDSSPTPGGETMRDAQARAVAHVAASARAHAGATVALVSHGDIIRAVVAHYLCLSLDHLARFEVYPASVTTLEIDGFGGRLVRLNEVPAVS